VLPEQIRCRSMWVTSKREKGENQEMWLPILYIHGSQQRVQNKLEVVNGRQRGGKKGRGGVIEGGKGGPWKRGNSPFQKTKKHFGKESLGGPDGYCGTVAGRGTGLVKRIVPS